MTELDPQQTPGDPGTSEGPSATESQEQTSDPAPVDPVAQKLSELETENKKLHKRLTDQGRKIANQERNSQVSEQPVEQAPSWDWENPAQSIQSTVKNTVSAALTDMEQRLEQKRQAEQTLRDFAEEKGIPTREFQRLNETLQQAANDPYEYLEMLARLHTAENTSEAISQARDAAVSAERNKARAITTEGGSTGSFPTEKSINDMTADELEEHIKANFGVEERDSY